MLYGFFAEKPLSMLRLCGKVELSMLGVRGFLICGRSAFTGNSCLKLKITQPEKFNYPKRDISPTSIVTRAGETCLANTASAGLASLCDLLRSLEYRRTNIIFFSAWFWKIYCVAGFSSFLYHVLTQVNMYAYSYTWSLDLIYVCSGPVGFVSFPPCIANIPSCVHKIRNWNWSCSFKTSDLKSYWHLMVI